MLLNSAAEGTAIQQVASFLRIAALVSLGLLGGTVDSEAQSPGQVRLSLLEASAGAAPRSCTLEVLVNKTSGDATLSCERHAPSASHLAAHRALTRSEAARLYTLASSPASSRPQGSGSPVPASADGPTVTITIDRGNQRVVLDASQGSDRLSGDDRRTLRLLREISDGLRGASRR